LYINLVKRLLFKFDKQHIFYGVGTEFSCYLVGFHSSKFLSKYLLSQKLQEFNQWFQNYASALLHVELESAIYCYKIQQSLIR